jgi:hypothetical protein
VKTYVRRNEPFFVPHRLIWRAALKSRCNSIGDPANQDEQVDEEVLVKEEFSYLKPSSMTEDC